VKISGDAHGRAYLTYQSNAYPTILNTQCLVSNTWFYFFIRGFFIIISLLRVSILSDGLIAWATKKSAEIRLIRENP